MITFRIVTPRVTKDIVFEDHAKGNEWLKKLYSVIGRAKEFRIHDVDKSMHTVHIDMPIKDLSDKGISFFGATTVAR